MAKICTVIRQLKGHRPVVSKIIRAPEGVLGVTAKDSYFNEQASSHIRIIKNDFVEFKDAEFFTDIHDENEICV